MKKPKKKKTSQSILEHVETFSEDLADGALWATEKVKNVDALTTKGNFNIVQYQKMGGFVGRLLTLKGLLEIAGLGNYVDFSMKQMIRSELGPKQIAALIPTGKK